MSDGFSYRITPLGILSLHLPVEVAKIAWEALKDRAERYGGDGVPAILCIGKGGSFIKLEVPKC